MSFLNSHKHDVIIMMASFVLLPILASGFEFQIDQPMGFYNDRISLYLQIRAMFDFDYFSIANLAYPGSFSYLNFPFSDFSQKSILIILSLFNKNVIEVSNLYYFFVIYITFIFSYLVFNLYLNNKIISVFAALIFLFVPYLEIRSTEHDFLAAFYSIPVTFYIVHEITRIMPNTDKSQLAKFYGQPLLQAALLLIATSGIYYTAFSFFFITAIGMSFAYIKREVIYARVAIFSCLIATLYLFLFEIPLLYHSYLNELSVTPRLFIDQSLYGVRFSDLIWTAQHYFSFKPFEEYWKFRGRFEGYDFWPGLFLSIIGISYLITSPLIRYRQNSAKKNLTDLSEQGQRDFILVLSVILVLSLFIAVVDGLGLIFNYFIPQIRSQNRISPYFTFALLLILAIEYQTIMANFRRLIYSKKQIGMISVCFLSLFFIVNNGPFLNFMGRHQHQLLNDQAYQTDSRSIQKAIAAIHSAGFKTVYQAPSAAWPEPKPVRSFDPYNHFFPYIFDTPNSVIKWSYGLTRDRVELDYLNIIERQTDGVWKVKALSCLGFDSILVEKRAYSDSEFRTFKNNKILKSVYEDSLRAVFSVPQAENATCMKDEFNKWISASDSSRATRYLVRNWYASDATGMWGEGDTQYIVIPSFLKAEGDLVVTIDSRVELPKDDPFKTISISLDKQVIGEWTFTEDKNLGLRSVTIPRSLLEKTRFRGLKLRISKPTEIINSDDSSQKKSLGIFITKLRFDFQSP